ncbi:Na+/H+ antiporter subunit G, partial [Cribrihabitans sp. XS_ASV171]
METVLEGLIAFFLIISGVFGFVGSYGMIKLKDPMSRLHAPTKATTLGVGGVLIASILHSVVVEGHLSMHELLITLFLFLTAPVTALFIAKWHIHRHERPDDLPGCGSDELWA